MHFRSLGILVVVCLAAAPLTGADLTWSGTNSGNWSDSANWGGSGVPADGDALLFTNAGLNKTMTNDIAGLENVNVTFQLNADGYTLSGNAIQLGAGGLSSGGDNVVNVDLAAGSGTQIAANYSSELRLNGTIDVRGVDGLTIASYDSSTLIVDGGIVDSVGSGSLLFGGDSRVWVYGANTYTGPVQIDAARAGINNSTLSGPFTMVDGQLALSTSGTAGSVTATGGEFFPGDGGNGIGFSGSLTFGPGVTYTEIVNEADPGVFGSVTVTGTVNLGGATLNLTGAGNVVPGTSLTIIANDGADVVTGSFAGLPDGAVIEDGPGGLAWRISYDGGDGNDVVLTAVDPATLVLPADVPALGPGMLMLLFSGLALAAFAALRR